MNPRLLRAPSESGGILAVPGFGELPALIEANRILLSPRYRELRVQARRDFESYFHSPLGKTGEEGQNDAPLIVTGHQPELFHPGVWIKNFAACGLARKVRGLSLNLIVDTDTVKSTSIRLPLLEDHTWRTESLAFDDLDRESTYESRRILNPHHFAQFPARLREATQHWPFRPLGCDHWHAAGPSLAANLIALRRELETQWVCDNRELPVSELSKWPSFRSFANEIANDQFRDVYNAAILQYRTRHKLRSSNHPAPLLEPGELPFWTVHTGQRQRTWKLNDSIRPKALILTLFARIILGDLFIHGLGGGKYDEVTDIIIRDYFRIEPPAYQVLTGTLHLPFNPSQTSDDALHVAERGVRDLHWNPQRHLNPADPRHAEVIAMPQGTKPERRQRFRRFRELVAELRPQVEVQLRDARQLLKKRSLQHAESALLRSREYSWILHPEETLRPFLQQFLR